MAIKEENQEENPSRALRWWLPPVALSIGTIAAGAWILRKAQLRKQQAEQVEDELFVTPPPRDPTPEPEPEPLPIILRTLQFKRLGLDFTLPRQFTPGPDTNTTAVAFDFVANVAAVKCFIEVRDMTPSFTLERCLKEFKLKHIDSMPGKAMRLPGSDEDRVVLPPSIQHDSACSDCGDWQHAVQWIMPLVAQNTLQMVWQQTLLAVVAGVEYMFTMQYVGKPIPASQQADVATEKKYFEQEVLPAQLELARGTHIHELKQPFVAFCDSSSGLQCELPDNTFNTFTAPNGTAEAPRAFGSVSPSDLMQLGQWVHRVDREERTATCWLSVWVKEGLQGPDLLRFLESGVTDVTRSATDGCLVATYRCEKRQVRVVVKGPYAVVAYPLSVYRNDGSPTDSTSLDDFTLEQHSSIARSCTVAKKGSVVCLYCASHSGIAFQLPPCPLFSTAGHISEDRATGTLKVSLPWMGIMVTVIHPSMIPDKAPFTHWTEHLAKRGGIVEECKFADRDCVTVVHETEEHAGQQWIVHDNKKDTWWQVQMQMSRANWDEPGLKPLVKNLRDTWMFM